MSPSKQTAAKTLFAAFTILKEAGGELSSKEITERVGQTVQFNERELQTYEKTGYVRRTSLLHFFSVDCIKAGFLIKRKGIWYLTEEGEKAMKEGPEKLLERANAGYKEWSKNKKKDTESNIDHDMVDELEKNESQFHVADLSQLEEKALEGLRNHVIKKNPYEFQDLSASLLKAMGYHVPYISPKGKDGGIDIIAYQDPLGARPPRIKIQVKHRPESNISIDEVQRLSGLLNKDGDIGIIITSGGFTNDAKTTARNSHVHIELIDFERFMELWKTYYDKLSDEEKNQLPLQPIYFLGSNEG
ncbi:MAG TPA: restriction endonuclease [Candidatus Absconditabacterales bacterium]|nr:restriction endonuclease [Candidatus Absconditabacterales bacterium]